MNTTIISKLFDTSENFIQRTVNAKEFVVKIGIFEMGTSINKTICIVALIEYIAIVGSVLAGQPLLKKSAILA